MFGYRFGTAVLVVAMLFCLLTTWTAATAPQRFAESLGLTIANAGGVNEIHAQYAGFFFAAAVVCMAALSGLISRQAGFVALAMIFGGLIGGRLVSYILNGGTAGYGPRIVSLYAIDSVGFVLAFAGLMLGKASS
jgi:hypothetical protein